MTIFGKPLSAYIGFAKVILFLIVIVGVARLALSLGGVANESVKYLSISVIALIGLFYFSIRVHTSGFGSYKQLLVLLVIQSVVAQGIVIAGILIAIFTRHDNIFSAPEYSGGGDGKTWLHVAAHVLVIIIGSLVLWLIGSLILLITKKAAPRNAAA